MLSVLSSDIAVLCVMQYADQGFLEVDGTYEWDNDYPNPVRPRPRTIIAPARCSPVSQADLRP